jgi:hypothetical protein
MRGFSVKPTGAIDVPPVLVRQIITRTVVPFNGGDIPDKAGRGPEALSSTAKSRGGCKPADYAAQNRHSRMRRRKFIQSEQSSVKARVLISAFLPSKFA